MLSSGEREDRYKQQKGANRLTDKQKRRMRKKSGSQLARERKRVWLVSGRTSGSDPWS